MAVFTVGWTLEAAESVATADDVEPDQVLDLLGRLIDKSLVTTDQLQAGRARYRLLESLRQYGQEQLVQRGEYERIRLRHAAYLLELFERSEAPLLSGADRAWLSRLDLEWSGCRFRVGQFSVTGSRIPYLPVPSNIGGGTVV